jgi:hypothetical protein
MTGVFECVFWCLLLGLGTPFLGLLLGMVYVYLMGKQK